MKMDNLLHAHHLYVLWQGYGLTQLGLTLAGHRDNSQYIQGRFGNFTPEVRREQITGSLK